MGHLVAAKVNIENTAFDKAAREYVLDANATLPDGINIFYWAYPYDGSITIRDFGMFTPRGTFRHPSVFQTMKYFPVAYLCSSITEYDGLLSLNEYRDAGLDDEVEIPIDLTRLESPFWPEAPSDEDNNVFFGGESAANSVRAIPKRMSRV